MDELLKKALRRWISAEDADSVNEIFGGVFCEEGEFAGVDLVNGEVRVCDKETGDLKRTISFKLTIEAT